MKVTNVTAIPQKPKFEPVEVTIRFETEDELLALLHRTNITPKVFNDKNFYTSGYRIPESLYCGEVWDVLADVISERDIK